MNLSTVIVFMLYGTAIIFIIYFIMSKNTSAPIIIKQEMPPPVVYSDASWWPWPTSTYNYYPYWTGYWNGGGNGGYGFWRRGGPRIHPHPRPRFSGGIRGPLGGRYSPISTSASRSGGGIRGGGRSGGRR